MPLEISEDLVSLAYQSLGYFVLEGQRVGNREIDLLAIRLGADGIPDRRLHVEVQIGISPIGALSGRSGNLVANRRPVEAAQEWADKKYRTDSIAEAVRRAFGGQPYQMVFVHGAMKAPEQLQVFEKNGIECVAIGELVREAVGRGNRNRLHRAVEIAALLRTTPLTK